MSDRFACSACGGEGRKLRSRYGGNDPDIWNAGPCEECDGTGEQNCEVCGLDVAVMEIEGHNFMIRACECCSVTWASDG